MACGFYIYSFKNYKFDFYSTQEVYDSQIYRDMYTFALNQKMARNLELISLFFFCLYSLKFFQLFDTVNIFFIAFKKANYEYLLLSTIIVFIFLGLSFLTNFVYGEYIYEYRDFLSSVIMNIKIFILNESTDVTESFLTSFRSFSVTIMIIFIFLLRYFLLNLYCPVYSEYLRIEYDLYLASQKAVGENEEIPYTIFEKIFYLFIPCLAKKKEKTEPVKPEQGNDAKKPEAVKADQGNAKKK